MLAELIGGYVLDEKSIASDEKSITSDDKSIASDEKSITSGVLDENTSL